MELFFWIVVVFSLWMAYKSGQSSKLLSETLKAGDDLVYKIPDKELFDIVKMIGRFTNQELWDKLIMLSNSDQTFEDFQNTGKICYRIRGHLNTAYRDLRGK